jgi:hypothetical protein
MGCPTENFLKSSCAFITISEKIETPSIGEFKNMSILIGKN